MDRATRRREIICTVLAGLLLGLGLACALFTSDPLWFQLAGQSIHPSTALYLAAVLFGGFYVARSGLHALLERRLGIDFLMSIAILGAIYLSEYVEAASLAFLFSLAELLEEFSIDRARHSLRELMKLSPNEARVKRDNEGEAKLLPVEQIAIGEIFIVKPGERIGLDGVVMTGGSAVNQAPITGESFPVEKRPGDQVFAGTINQEGYLEIRATKRAQDTTLARIIHLVEEAEAQKAPSERFVERFGRYYTPTVVALAIAIAIIPPIWIGASFNVWFLRALTLLVIACPCALIISTPVSVISAITAAARHGVLIKGGIYLEEMGKIRAVAFDKTGTLTVGRPGVTDLIPLNGHSHQELLTLAASLERFSQHPIAQAIVERADGQTLRIVEGFAERAGHGVLGRIDGQSYMLGKPELFPDAQRGLPQDTLRRLQGEGKTVMFLGRERELLGAIAVADRVRDEAPEALRRLRALGLELVLITGDNEGTARAIASRLGITHYHAAVLPDEKLHEIHHLIEEYGSGAMVGDGVNDAPALAAASVGIAMGAAGSDTALETADVALLSDDLMKLPYLLQLSRKSRRVIQQNIWASITIKFALAAGVFPGLVTLVLAVLIGDMGASLAVIGNALRLARLR
jgi:Cd2+/Zn2+-exporting ATPase